ncbi:MAG: metal-dependent phosphohydrolase [Actinomycetia bacterium]|nr:metal-dependent phosphohydrolase [Actinomycetes bacterium]MCP3912990.1 metal-dependent phosphohydrolase [Actinomycetes bacterium]
MANPERARSRWAALTIRLGVGGDAATAAQALGEQLIDAYTGPRRHHHDIGHVVEVLDAVDSLLGPSVPVEAELATWFHDAVYEGRAGDDERASALLAREVLGELGLDPALVERTAGLVEATVNHSCGPGDDIGEAFLDADLSVLGTDPVRYDTYVSAVRREYGHLDDQTWRTGRANVLTALLDRPRLFLSEAGRARWEDQARANMTRERQRLKAQ